MSRTNVEVDDKLVRRAMELYRLRTKREVIDLALRTLVGDRPRIDTLELEGSGWEGDLKRLREGRLSS